MARMGTAPGCTMPFISSSQFLQKKSCKLSHKHPRQKTGKSTKFVLSTARQIHQFLLAVLGDEDDYVDVSTLMLKITNFN